MPAKVQNFIDELPSRLAGDSAPIRERPDRSSADSSRRPRRCWSQSACCSTPTACSRAARKRGSGTAKRVDRFGELFYRIVGRYSAGSLLVAVIAGLGVLMVRLIFGVPLTPMLAVWVALFDLVPQIGGAVGGIPFVLLALTQGPTVGAVVAVYFVLYSSSENHVLQPLIVGRRSTCHRPHDGRRPRGRVCRRGTGRPRRQSRSRRRQGHLTSNATGARTAPTAATRITVATPVATGRTRSVRHPGRSVCEGLAGSDHGT